MCRWDSKTALKRSLPTMSLDKVTLGSVQQAADELLKFDGCNVLEGDTQTLVQQHTQEIKDNLREANSIIWGIGRNLFEIRNLLKPRCFKVWLESEFRWSRPTAYNYINVYKAFPSGLTIRHLPIDPTALYRLAAPSTPESARLEAVERADSGERITLKAAKSIIGSKKQKLVTSNTDKIHSKEDYEAAEVIARASEQESLVRNEPLPSEKFADREFPDAVTIDVVARTMPAEEKHDLIALMQLEEKLLETTFVPPQSNCTSISNQNADFTCDRRKDESALEADEADEAEGMKRSQSAIEADSSLATASNQNAAFTCDSSLATAWSKNGTSAYNASAALISNLSHLTVEEAHMIFRAFLQKLGISAISDFVKELQTEEIVTLCNQCFDSISEQGFNSFKLERVNFALLSDPVLKQLLDQIKRVILSRGARRIVHPIQSEPFELRYGIAKF